MNVEAKRSHGPPTIIDPFIPHLIKNHVTVTWLTMGRCDRYKRIVLRSNLRSYTILFCHAKEKGRMCHFCRFWVKHIFAVKRMVTHRGGSKFGGAVMRIVTHRGGSKFVGATVNHFAGLFPFVVMHLTSKRAIEYRSLTC